MITSTLLRHGVEYVGEMLPAIQKWLDENDYHSVEQLKGSMSYRQLPRLGQFGTGKLHESNRVVYRGGALDGSDGGS